ncbi:MAG: SRPBCC family protein [Bacteroidota bacterium]
MKLFIKIIYWFLGILAVLLIVAYLLPKNYKVERSIYINADKELIYNLTSNFQKWTVWVPWTKEMDSTAVFEITGPDGQIGTTWKWNGKKMGDGTMTASELVPGKLIAYDLSFAQGKYKSKGKILINEGDSCQVSWSDEGDLGYNPLNRFMGLFMGKMMGPDFEKGLAKLKKIAEERKSWPKIEEIKMPSQVVLFIRDSAGPKTYETIMGKAYQEIYSFMCSQKLRQTGAPFAIYIKWDSITMFSVMDIGIPVEKVEKGKGRIQVKQLPEQNGVKAIYFGPYSKTAGTYYALMQYCKENNKIESGGPWEIYITDPMKEKDTMKWETDIIFPVK